MVRAIVDLAQALDIEIIGEGVETYLQAAHLRAMHCHRVQGYLFGEPRDVPYFAVPEVRAQLDEFRKAAV